MSNSLMGRTMTRKPTCDTGQQRQPATANSPYPVIHPWHKAPSSAPTSVSAHAPMAATAVTLPSSPAPFHENPTASYYPPRLPAEPSASPPPPRPTRHPSRRRRRPRLRASSSSTPPRHRRCTASRLYTTRRWSPSSPRSSATPMSTRCSTSVSLLAIIG